MKKVRSQAAFVISDAKRLDELITNCEKLYDEGYAANEGAAVASGRIHRYCSEFAQTPDLYLEIKDRDNARAKKVLDAVSDSIITVHDALIASIIGNAMDTELPDTRLQKTLRHISPKYSNTDLLLMTRLSFCSSLIM